MLRNKKNYFTLQWTFLSLSLLFISLLISLCFFLFFIAFCRPPLCSFSAFEEFQFGFRILPIIVGSPLFLLLNIIFFLLFLSLLLLMLSAYNTHTAERAVVARGRELKFKNHTQQWSRQISRHREKFPSLFTCKFTKSATTKGKTCVLNMRIFTQSNPGTKTTEMPPQASVAWLQRIHQSLPAGALFILAQSSALPLSWDRFLIPNIFTKFHSFLCFFIPCSTQSS